MKESNDDNVNTRMKTLKQKLIFEINKFKKEILKLNPKSFKGIKTTYLSQYIKHNNMTIKNFPEIIWNHSFNKLFLEKIENFNFDLIIEKIIKILIGDFTGMKRGQIDEDYPSYYLTLLIEKNQKIIICIYFELIDSENNIVQEKIEFIDIDCVIKFNYEIEKRSKVEYDKTGIIKNKHLFFSKIILEDKSEIYYPYDNFLISNSNVFYSILGENNVNIQIKLKESEYIQDKYISNIIEEHNFNGNHNEIINELFNSEWNYTFSRQEKFLINTNKPFLLSGQPGTGKTTVILNKIFASYFSMHVNYSIMKLQEINWYYINNKILVSDFKQNFKIAFVSLNQKLCDNIFNLYDNMIKHLAIQYNPINKNIKYNSFLEINSYPIFFNFRKMLFLIDGSINFQFFKRNDHKAFQPVNFECLTRYVDDMEYLCNNYYKNELDFSFQTFFIRSPILVNLNPIRKKEINEKGFHIFYEKLKTQIVEFKKKRSQKKNNKNNRINIEEEIKEQYFNSISNVKASEMEIYSQIFSVIKGSLLSYTNYSNCLTWDEYNKKGQKLTDFNEEERKGIYDICILYEQYKIQNNLFDIQDLTNHLIRQVKIELLPSNIHLIDFLYFDEIQDMTINQIYLLLLISKYSKVYAGDTCQTISQSNRFRFVDLKNIFWTFEKIISNYNKVEQAILSLNYRLNSHILKLANFISFSIKRLFPYTLDKFKDDFSVKITPFRPTLINEKDFIYLINIIKGKIGLEQLSLTLSYYCTFICRNNESIIKFNNKYLKYNEGEVYIIDIEQSKGIEYNIIILYNFFTDCSEENKRFWEWFIQKTKTKKENKFTRDLRNILEKEDLSDIYFNTKKNEGDNKINKTKEKGITDEEREEIINKIIKIHEDFIYPEINYDNFDKHDFFSFCTEIKQFYVGITRAETFLIFYEESDFGKKIIQFFIDNELISKDSNLIINQIEIKLKNLEILIENNKEIREKANKLFEKKEYKRASFLYKKINDRENSIKSEIYDLYTEILQNENKFLNNENRQILIDNNTRIITLFKELNHFKDLDGIEGYAYINLNKIDEAIESYEKNKLFNKVAYVFYSIKKDFKKAFYYYNLDNNYTYCILCLENLKNYKQLYNYINKNYFILGKIQYIHLYKTYFNDFFKTQFNFENNDYPNLNEKKLLEFFEIFFSRYDNFKDKDNTPKENTNVKARLENNLNLFNPSERITSIINAYIFKKEKFILREIIEQIPMNLFFNYYSKEETFFSSNVTELTNIESLELFSPFSKIEIKEKYKSDKLSQIISLGLEKIDVCDNYKKEKIKYMIQLLNRFFLKNVKLAETKFFLGYCWLYRPLLYLYQDINKIYNSQIFNTIYFNYIILLDYCDKLEELEYSFNKDNLCECLKNLIDNFIDKIEQSNPDFYSNSLKLSSIIFMDNKLFFDYIENYNLETIVQLIEYLILLYNFCQKFEYSISEIININFFSIFNAALIIYVPHLTKSTKIIELFSTQNICLIHKKSILFKNNNSLNIIINNKLGVFDSTYRNIIIKYNTCFDLLELYINKKISILRNLLFKQTEVKNSFLQPIIFDFQTFFLNNKNNFNININNEYIIKKSSFEKSAFLLFNTNNRVSNIFFAILKYISKVCFENYKKLKWEKEEYYFSYFNILISEAYTYKYNKFDSNDSDNNNYDKLFNKIENLYQDFPIISVLLLKILYFQLFNYKKISFYNDNQIYLSNYKNISKYYFKSFINLLSKLIDLKRIENPFNDFFQLNLSIIIKNLSFVNNFVKKNITNLNYFSYKNEYIKYKKFKTIKLYQYSKKIYLYNIKVKKSIYLNHLSTKKTNTKNKNSIWNKNIEKNTIEYQLLFNNLNNKKKISEIFWNIIGKYPIFENEMNIKDYINSINYDY